MKTKCSGKIYKFSDGMEVIVSPLTVGDYISIATKYLSDVTEKNMNHKMADVYIAQFTYLIKDVVGRTFVSDDSRRKFLYDYISHLYKLEDEVLLDHIEGDTIVNLVPIKCECACCGEIIDLCVEASMPFSGYNNFYPKEFYEIPKNILPSNGIPYPENLQIYIKPLPLSEQKLLEYCNQANYYSKLLDGIYISGDMSDREQLLFADVQFLDILRRMYVYDTNSSITVKSYKCEHCGEYNDISFKINDVKFENMPKEMFESVEFNVNENYNGERASKSFAKAESLYEEGYYTAAIDYCTKAIDISSHNNEADCYYSLRAHCYIELKQYQEAVDNFTKAIKLKPHNIDNLGARAFCYKELEQYEKAIDDYTKVIDSCNKNNFEILFDAYRDRIKCYVAIKDYESAKADCKYIIDNKDNFLFVDEENNIEVIEYLYEQLSDEDSYDGEEDKKVDECTAYFDKAHEYLFKGEIDKAHVEFFKAYICYKDFFTDFVNELLKEDDLLPELKNVYENILNFCKKSESCDIGSEEILHNLEKKAEKGINTNISALHNNPKQGRKLDI